MRIDLEVRVFIDTATDDDDVDAELEVLEAEIENGVLWVYVRNVLVPEADCTHGHDEVQVTDETTNGVHGPVRIVRSHRRCRRCGLDPVPGSHREHDWQRT